MRLELEVALARGVGRLSRLARAGGGTTLPGKLLTAVDRYGELEIVADRWRRMVPDLPHESVLVLNADDPLVVALAAEHANSVTFGVDDPAHARPDLQHAADSKYCIRCGTPYEYAAAYVGHLGDYRCPACGHSRPPLDVVARDLELNGLESVGFTLVTPAESRRVELQIGRASCRERG